MYTKGEWKLHRDGEGNPQIFAERKDTGNVIAKLVADNLANAHLIIAAVNGCIAVNPDNPQAVGEAIKDMYEALLSALGSLMVFDTKEHTWVKPIMNNIQTVLSKAKGREA